MSDFYACLHFELNLSVTYCLMVILETFGSSQKKADKLQLIKIRI